MYSGFRLQKPVRILAANLQNGSLDAGFLALTFVEQLDLETFALRPARVHPHDHLGSVLCFRTACPGADFQLCVAEVVLPAEQRLELERVEVGVDGFNLNVELLLELGVRRVAKQLVQLPRALESPGEPVVWP